MADKKTLDLARQWAADIDADRETLSQDTIDAAADLISSLPDEWVSVDELRKYITEWRAGLATAPRDEYEDEILDGLEDMLPAPKPRTLADIPPEEQEACRGMQAEVLGMKMWLIVGKDPTREGWWIVTTRSGRTEFRPSLHIVPLPELPRMQWPGSEPEETHFDDLPDEVKQVMEESVEDYKAGRFVDFDTPESASPRPEDVPAPSRTMFPGGRVWYIDGPVGDVRATSAGKVVAFGTWQEQPFRIVATPEEMRTLARTLEAAADRAETEVTDV